MPIYIDWGTKDGDDISYDKLRCLVFHIFSDLPSNDLLKGHWPLKTHLRQSFPLLSTWRFSHLWEVRNVFSTITFAEKTLSSNFWGPRFKFCISFDHSGKDRSARCAISLHTVDRRNPKKPPGMYKTLQYNANLNW